MKLHTHFISVKNLGLFLILLPGISYLAFLLSTAIAGRGYPDSILFLPIAICSITAFIITWRWSCIGSLVTIGSALLVAAPLTFLMFAADLDPWETFNLLVLPFLSYISGGFIVFLSGRRTRKEKLALYITCFVALSISIIWVVFFVN